MQPESLFVSKDEFEIAEKKFPNYFLIKAAIQIAINSEIEVKLSNLPDEPAIALQAKIVCYQEVAIEILYFLSAVKIDLQDGSLIWKSKKPLWVAERFLRTELAALLAVSQIANCNFKQLYRIDNDKISLKEIMFATLCYLKSRAFELGGDTVFQNFKEPLTFWETVYSSICDCGFFQADKRCKFETAQEIQCAPCNIL